MNLTLAVDEEVAERARRAAQASDARLAAGRTLGPLDGLVFAIKDNIDLAGLPTTGGIAHYRGTLAPDDAPVVARLRARKKRDAKPFALLARDLAVIRRYCAVSAEEEAALRSPEGPIVLLRACGSEALPAAIAPGLTLLGFMLPTTPLHLLIVEHLDRPLVMTSGNLSDEPPVTADAEVERRLGEIADHALIHDRPIESRVDDSVLRVMAGRARLLRRARGHAPSPIRLPRGFEAAPPLLAFGGELKATFCLLREGEAIVSQHQGDLEDKGTFDDYRKNLALYARIFDHAPAALVVDRHPEYLSTQLGRARSLAEGLPLVEVQHHHAHLASCLAENGWPLDGAPVLGVLLDGLGLGDDGALWGGEFLLGDYRAFQRVGTFKPVALLGGAQAAREPWRNLYAQLVAGPGWAAVSARFGDLPLHAQLDAKPRALLDGMLRAGLASPLASSCGRLFDAVAAALGLCFERQAYEGQAGALLEACVDEGALRGEDEALAYPITMAELPGGALPQVEPRAMWGALLDDLARRTPPGVMAARFHRGLARAIGAMVERAAGPEGERRFDTVALSGGCFQNRVLFEEVERRITAGGFRVLSQARVPPNDGGLSLGQAAIAAARLLGLGALCHGVVVDGELTVGAGTAGRDVAGAGGASTRLTPGRKALPLGPGFFRRGRLAGAGNSLVSRACRS